MPKHNLRNKNGQFRTVPRIASIVPGRLYNFKGVPVRAGKDRQKLPNGGIARLVTSHKLLHGFVPENQLGYLMPEEVRNYLAFA